MSSSEFDNDETSVVIVSLNISDTNITVNASQPKTLAKRLNEDSSISGMLIGIGIAVIALVGLLIIIKLIHRCYKMWREEDDDNKTDQTRKSPLLPSSTANVVRRNSSVRNPTVPIRRSSLNIQTQMEIRQKRLSQVYSNTPPSAKKP